MVSASGSATGRRWQSAVPIWIAGAPAAVAFIALMVASTRSEPPLPAYLAGAYVVFLVLFILLTYHRVPDLSFILPGASLFTYFVIFPSIDAFRLSLFNFSGYVPPTEFVGFKWYEQILTTDEVSNALWHGIALFGILFVLHNTISLGLAVLLDTRLRFYEFYRALYFLPVIVSGVATGFIWQIIFGSNIGLVNPLLGQLGLSDWQQDWQGGVPWAWWVVVLVSFWKGNGIPVVFYLAGLQGVPNELREAARIDGANAFQVFLHIVFPLIAPMFTIVTALTFLGAMTALEIPLLIGGMNGGSFQSTDFLNLVIIRNAFGGGFSTFDVIRNPGYAVAVGVVMFFLILVVLSVQLFFLRRREVRL